MLNRQNKKIVELLFKDQFPDEINGLIAESTPLDFDEILKFREINNEFRNEIDRLDDDVAKKMRHLQPENMALLADIPPLTAFGAGFMTANGLTVPAYTLLGSTVGSVFGFASGVISTGAFIGCLGSVRNLPNGMNSVIKGFLDGAQLGAYFGICIGTPLGIVWGAYLGFDYAGGDVTPFGLGIVTGAVASGLTLFSQKTVRNADIETNNIRHAFLAPTNTG